MEYSVDDQKEALDSVDTKGLGGNELAEEVLVRGEYITSNVTVFKTPRLKRIAKYRDLYAGNVKRKYRQPFNVVLPVFSGMLDTLMAAFNDDLSLEFTPQTPADYLAVRKLNALWTMETASTAPNAKFALKTRQDRSNALFSGRGFLMNYAVSDPEYHNCLEVFELEDAIFQPQGGGHLENHLYAGRENIVRSASDLENGPYDQAQVKKLIDIAAKTDYFPENQQTKETLTKFKAMGLNTSNAAYVGEHLFQLVEMVVEMKGVRYYIVFSPWYRIWVRFDKLSVLHSADLMPYVSWATHEDNRNFLSKSYCDDLFGVADSVHTLFNQELTNREKKNFHPRAYDKDMFPDVSKLDLAQSRPDALVPADTKGGTRKISEGIYTFETAELQGTINLIEWIKQETGRDIGVTDLAMGGSQGVSKRASVVLAEQQAIAKRMLLRSSPYTEAMSEIGKRFLEGCKDHLPVKKAIRLIGDSAEGWEEITRMDLDLYSDVDVRITSSAIEMQNSHLKKEARMKELDSIALNPALLPYINPRKLVEEKLRSGAEYDDNEVKLLMDTKNYGDEEEVAYAHRAIMAIIDGTKPEMYYGATSLFMEILHDYANNNRTSIGMPKFKAMLEFSSAHAQIAQDNMTRKARADAQQQGNANPSGESTPANTVPANNVAPAKPAPSQSSVRMPPATAAQT